MWRLLTWSSAESGTEDEVGGIKVQLGHVEGEFFLEDSHVGAQVTWGGPSPTKDGVVDVHCHFYVHLG